MKRLLAALIPLVLLMSACASGDPKPTTYISDIGATLNGDVRSSVVGDTEFWWRYGQTTAYGSETPHRTVAIADSEPHPVSQPITGLTADTTYHHQFCVSDEEEDPPRVVCNTDRTFTTGPPGGRSGITFTRLMQNWQDVWLMDGDGSDPVNITSSVATPEFSAAFSPDGRRLAFAAWGSSSSSTEIWVMLADGSDPLALTAGTNAQVPDWSPDGSKIAYTSFSGGGEIYVMDADGTNRTNVTNHPANDVKADWSPDGSKLAFTSNRDGNDELYVMEADGSNPIRLTHDPSQDLSPAWSPDGTKLAFGSSRDGDFEIYVMDADGTNPVPLTTSTAFDGNPDWSPDGSKIVFDSKRDGGDQQVYVMDADGGNQTRLTTNPKADVGPRWSPRPEPVE